MGVHMVVVLEAVSRGDFRRVVVLVEADRALVIVAVW